MCVFWGGVDALARVPMRGMEEEVWSQKGAHASHCKEEGKGEGGRNEEKEREREKELLSYFERRECGPSLK